MNAVASSRATPATPVSVLLSIVRLRPSIFWTALLVLMLVMRAPSLFVEVLDPDEAGHAVGSLVWMDGGSLYYDYIDNKQPLLYLTYAAVFSLFGRNLIAVHVLTLPWLLLTAWLIARVARQLWSSDAAGRTAAILFVLTSSGNLEKDMLATNTEILMNLPLVAAFTLAFPKGRGQRPLDAAIGGVAVGLAALYSLKALVALPILVIAPLARDATARRSPASALGALLAAMVPLTAVVLWFAANGHLADLIYWNVSLNRKYAAAGVPFWLFETRRGILYGLPRLLIFMAATAAPWIGAAAATADVLRNKSPSPARRPLWFVLWLLLSFYPVCAGGRFYGHYFIQFLPPLAIVSSGWLASRIFAAESSSRTRWTLLGALFLPIVGFTAFGYIRLATSKLEGQHPQVAAVATWLRQNTVATDRLFIWGYWSQVYYYSDRRPASRFVYPQTLSGYIPGSPRSLDPHDDTSDYIVPEHWDMLREDFKRHPAEIILDTAPAAIHFWEKYPVDNYPFLKTLLLERYHREATVAGVVIYRLNS